jgi:SRSO17 transposase
LIERVARATPPPSGRPPQVNIAPRQVAGLKQKLIAYHRDFASLFRRKEQRVWSLKYLEGQLLDLKRKSIEPMATAVDGGNIQALQQFVGLGAWSDAKVIRTHQARVARTLGRPDGVLLLDGCDFPKQGDQSVGVARQYCGPLGKIANCQASVVLAYASEAGATLLDRRLVLPEEWFDAAHQARWVKGGIPKDTAFRTKPALGAEMVEALIDADTVPFRWVAMDEGFGQATHLLDKIHARNKYFFAEIPCNTRAWRRRPKLLPLGPKPATGRPPTVRHLAPDAPVSQRVDQLARQLPAKRWRRTIVHEGSQGPMAVEIAVVRAVMSQDSRPGREEWLVIRRPLGRQSETPWKYYRSNAPRRTSWRTLARLTAWRWPVETVIKECKTELGLDQYEVRGWLGWHHHFTLTMLAHHFLVELRLEMGADAPALTVAQARQLLQIVLPKRKLDAKSVVAEIERVQRQNYAAYRSHRKRHWRRLKKPETKVTL